MHNRIRYSSAAILLLCTLVLAGCSKHPALTAPAQNSANAASADQTNAAPPAANDSANSNQPQAADDNAGNGPAANQNGATIANSQGYAPQGSPSPNNNPTPVQPLIVPAGTPVVVRLQQSLSSASAVSGERFEAVLDQPLVVQNEVIAPVGTPVVGHVTIARRSGRFHHPGEIGLTLDSVVLGQQRVPILTSSVVARGASHKKHNLGWIGGGTGGGALIGALAAGGKGALIGGGIGAAAGTTTALLTGKKDVTFGAERRLTFRLHHDLTLQS